jgi:hypothetical protein
MTGTAGGGAGAGWEFAAAPESAVAGVAAVFEPFELLDEVVVPVLLHPQSASITASITILVTGPLRIARSP